LLVGWFDGLTNGAVLKAAGLDVVDLLDDEEIVVAGVDSWPDAGTQSPGSNRKRSCG
jgi:hypothetical protein